MTDAALHAALAEHYGFAEFRPGQEAVVRAALAGRDTLAVMPTGAGKSLTYQLAAMLRPTPTLVLSPLIALMKDQVDKLPAAIGATATFVNSSLGADDAAGRLASVADGRTRILYAAPERLRQERFVRTLREIGVGLVVIDEVHCVSMWGHDFRPDYLFIRRALDAIGAPAVLGMTATATPADAESIAEALGRRLDVVRTSVHRPNLRYDVERAENAEERLRGLLRGLRRIEDGAAAIVYARSRRSCEEIARTVVGYGVRAAHYHAGLEPDERTRVQDAFITGRTPVVVATTAFGMGIDKADVRLVALVNLPDSLESYVQMVGRAGRDGAPSDTVLFAGDADATSLRRFALQGVPTPDLLRQVYRLARDAGGCLDPDAVASALGSGHDPRVLVGMLEQAGIVRRDYDTGRAMQLELLPVEPGTGGVVEELLERYTRETAARVERIVGFTKDRRCRHLQVVEHFGETLETPCGVCDVCAPRAAGRDAPAPPAAALPDDPAGAIVTAVDELRWPLGRRSLVAMLRGSVSAPPSARRSRAFGSLAAASEAEVGRWVRALESAGALVEVESDGFRVLEARPEVELPTLGRRAREPVSEPLAAELRAWRARRAREDGVPAYVVLHDATLDELAASRPGSTAELAAVKGVGPAKLDRYGAELLEVLATT